MKKRYMKPRIEVVKLESQHMLAASPPVWSGEVGSPELDNLNDWEEIVIM